MIRSSGSNLRDDALYVETLFAALQLKLRPHHAPLETLSHTPAVS